MARWYLTVDRGGKRGIFARNSGATFSSAQQHSKEEMEEILGRFATLLDPQSLLLSEDTVREHHLFHPLSEYSDVYGVVLKSEV